MSKSGDQEGLIDQEDFEIRRTWGFYEDSEGPRDKAKTGIEVLVYDRTADNPR